MKKAGIIIGFLIAITAVLLFLNNSLYPSLPIEGLSAKEALNKLEETDSPIAEIAKKEKYSWYITSTDPSGMLSADEAVKKMVESDGWEFTQKDGSGLFFEKDGQKLIATTQMLTGDYVLVKIPNY
ncbi:hypothetical protein SAMN04487944_1092 [Gracilibacillus ureilyticus]|uniref:Uncharacterized protein n=1 Tax=Gracilibacillus ureilyticus TaxID=531814 RepID=A0A1H9RIS7_9BACI|nr:hypothetical protein [Gracilibacillus ureilyticus]SER72646.1 hypothetical protein SAMN04487944_1092 [Gracilibacillus ureilyticus]